MEHPSTEHLLDISAVHPLAFLPEAIRDGVALCGGMTFTLDADTAMALADLLDVGLKHDDHED